MTTVTDLRFLICDASEGSEVILYFVNGRDAPPRMKRHLNKTGKQTFESIVQDGAEGLDGLVNEDSSRADEYAEEVWDWIRDSTVAENKFVPSVHGRERITHTITIAGQ